MVSKNQRAYTNHHNSTTQLPRFCTTKSAHPLKNKGFPIRKNSPN
jgi:hypothetical protein